MTQDTLAGVNTGPSVGRRHSGIDRSLSATSFDHSAFDRVVHRVVNAEGLVDYASLKHDPGQLNRYLALLAKVDLAARGETAIRRPRRL